MIDRQLFQSQIQRRLEENPRAWLKYGILAAVLVASVGLAFIDNQRLLLLPPVAIAGVALLVLFLREPSLGLLAMVIASLVIPSPFSSSRTGNINPGMMIEILLVGLWLLDMIARRRHISLAPSRTNLPLFLFMIWSVIALINGQINYYFTTQLASPIAQISGLAIFILSGVAYLLVGNLTSGLVWLKRLTWLFIILSAFYIFGRLIPPVKPYIFRVYQYGSDGSIFWIWLVAMISSQLLLNRQLSQRVRLALGAVLAGTLYIALIEAYSWKSGWLPAMLAVAVIVFIGLPRFRTLSVFVAIFVGILGSSKIASLVSSGEDYSISTRTVAWNLVLQIVKANPILGLGPANYYWYTPLFPILGYAVNYNSHNNYIDILAQMGIIGLALFLWFAWEVGFLGWKLKDVVPDGFERAYVIGVLGGLAGTLVTGMLGDWFFPFVYNVGLHGYRSSILAWLFLGGLVFLEQVYLRQGKGEPADH